MELQLICIKTHWYNGINSVSAVIFDGRHAVYTKIRKYFIVFLLKIKCVEI